MNAISKKRLCERTPDGQKTPKMVEVERRLGRTLEEDFQEYYVEKGWGQQRIAKRWGVKKEIVFHSSVRNRSRSWAQMLKLPVRRLEEECDGSSQDTGRGLTCEVCEEVGEHFDRAHWIADRDGGAPKVTTSFAYAPIAIESSTEEIQLWQSEQRRRCYTAK